MPVFQMIPGCQIGTVRLGKGNCSLFFDLMGHLPFLRHSDLRVQVFRFILDTHKNRGRHSELGI